MHNQRMYIRMFSQPRMLINQPRHALAAANPAADPADSANQPAATDPAADHPAADHPAATSQLQLRMPVLMETECVPSMPVPVHGH